MKILWIPHTGWHIPQRAHLFCRALAEQHEVHVTDWVADFIHVQDFFSRRYIQNFIYRQHNDGNIRVHGIPRISPALFFAPLRRFNSRLFAQTVQKIIEQYKIDVVVGTFVCPPPDAPRLVFDLFDDNTGYWRSYGIHRAYADEIEETEAAYLRKAHAVVASSSVLVEIAKRRGARGPVHFIPNGVETALYKSSNGAVWRARLGLTGVVVGVLGNHDKPAEMEKVLMAAQLLRDEAITFVVAGRGAALALAQKRANSLDLQHVHFIGAVLREEVPDILAAFDIGICPYLKGPGADAGSPMRLLQYAAAGLPTVCTEIEEVRRMAFPNVVLVEDNARDLVRGIRQALGMPRQCPAQIAAYDLPVLTVRYEAVLAGSTP
jgi:glycosyltransferase involved in cell wall biosynthesis